MLLFKFDTEFSFGKTTGILTYILAEAKLFDTSLRPDLFFQKCDATF